MGAAIPLAVVFFGIAFGTQGILKITGQSSEDSFVKSKSKKTKKTARSIVEQEFAFEVNQSE